MDVMFHKCKNSVFCACFLLFFLTGTICGTFALSLLPHASVRFMQHAVWRMDRLDHIWMTLSSLRPICVVVVFALHPQGYRAVFPLVFVRGFLTVYCFAVLVSGSCSVWSIFAKELITIAIFFIASKWVYFRWGLSSPY